MKNRIPTKFIYIWSLTIFFLAVFLVPNDGRADAASSFIQVLFGQGGRNFGQSDVLGPPANQVIPLLQQIYQGTVNNGGVDNNGKQLQTKTSTDIADFLRQGENVDLRKIQEAQIAQTHPEISPLACSIATVNQSVPAISLAGQNTTAQIMNLIATSLYEDPMSGTNVAALKKKNFWCRIGAIANDKTCDTPPYPRVLDSYLNRQIGINGKDCVPCDMKAVMQDLQKMAADDKYSPPSDRAECLAAIGIIRQTYANGRRKPTPTESKSSPALSLWEDIADITTRASEGKGSALASLAQRICVPTSVISDCWKGLKGSGGEDGYTLLVKYYSGNSNRTDVPPFGMPPANYCPSMEQIRIVKSQIENTYLEKYSGTVSTEQALRDLVALSISGNQDQREFGIAGLDASNGGTSPEEFGGGIPRPVSENANPELLNAIKQLTSAVERLGNAPKGGFGDKVQDVRWRDDPPRGSLQNNGHKNSLRNQLKNPQGKALAVKQVSAQNDKGRGDESEMQIHDALKELGLKVSLGASQDSGNDPASGGALNKTILPPLTQQFPTVP